MNDKFQPLDGDDDVLLFDTKYIYSGQKVLMSQQFQEKFLRSYHQKPSYHGGLSQERTDIKSDLSTISFDSGGFICSEIQWKCIKAVNCKLLKVGSGGWQEGKLRMQAKVVNSYYENDDYKKYNKAVLDICIEFSPDIPTEPIYWMQSLSINEETTIQAGDINWSSPQEGIDCQILKIGAKGWQKGKLKIEVNKNINSSCKTQTSIKFCPDEPLEPKSPLDDIRQSEEYKKLSNNN